MNGRTQMRKISLFAVCPECGATLCSERCWSCDGTAASWITICEECGGGGQLLLCPNRACRSQPPPVIGASTPADQRSLNNLQCAGCRLPRNIQKSAKRCPQRRWDWFG